MAEFKVTEEFDADVATLNAAGFGVNVNTYLAALNDITTMKTASQFYCQHQAIKQIMDLYAKLLMKEADDLRSMAAEAKLLDMSIATQFVVDGIEKRLGNLKTENNGVEGR